MPENIYKFFVGVGSILGIELTPNVVDSVATFSDYSAKDVTDITQVLIQIIIGIVTLIHLFKKKKENDSGHK